MKLKNNAKHRIFGKPKTIKFEKNKTTKPLVVMSERIIKVYRSELHRDKHDQILEKWLREAFRAYVEKKAEKYAKKYGFRYNRIAIKDTKTRWGSCSSKMNLSFNWRLIFTPNECIDYVILHELAHTKQMNHSYKFWDLVRSMMPKYEEARLLLQSYEDQVLKR